MPNRRSDVLSALPAIRRGLVALSFLVPGLVACTSDDPVRVTASGTLTRGPVSYPSPEVERLSEAYSRSQEQRWYAEVARQWLESAWYEAVRPKPPRSTPSHTHATRSYDGIGPCGGDLPPCYVKMRESRGDYRAENPRSTASGAWQFIDSTWAGYGGYAHASDAPPELQDQRARDLWAGGAGCSHWSAC